MPLLLQPKPNIVIIDDCAQLWATSWPTNGTVKDLGDALHRLIFHTKLRTQTYTLCLTGTRAQRTGSIASNHAPLLSTPIPSKEDTMLSTGNKVQIYHLYHL